MKKKKGKVKVKRVIAILLILYILVSIVLKIYNRKISNIIIKNNYYVEDVTIIEALKIKEMPSLYTTSTREYKKRAKTIELIDDIDIKRNVNGKLEITVKELKPILFNNNTNKVLLSDMTEINSDNKIRGIPILVNYVPLKILTKFTKELSTLDYGTLSLINEIKYMPRRDETGNIIDETIFSLHMNDGNTIITNSDKVKTVKNYIKIFDNIGVSKGTLNLDSGDYENYVFTPYE